MATLQQTLRTAFEPLLRRGKHGLTEKGLRAVLALAADEDEGEALLGRLGGWDLRTIRNVAGRLATDARKKGDEEALYLCERLRAIALAVPPRRSREAVAAGKLPLCKHCLRALRPVQDSEWDGAESHMKCFDFVFQHGL